MKTKTQTPKKRKVQGSKAFRHKENYSEHSFEVTRAAMKMAIPFCAGRRKEDAFSLLYIRRDYILHQLQLRNVRV